MDYELTEQQQAIVDITREIAQKKIKPVREHYDKTEEYPWEIVEELRKAGIPVPEHLTESTTPPAPSASPAPKKEPTQTPPLQPTPAPPTSAATPPSSPTPAPSEEESRKRFTKKY